MAGGLIGLLLGVFAISYLVDQVILGVVLNVFVSGLTGYLYDKLLVPYANTLNSPATYLPIKIPLLGDIPIIGPVFFDSTLFLYITYILVASGPGRAVQTRWGLRVRAVGEHPTAADTVGISVRLTRYRNVILAGLIAGIGGAFLTIGSVGIVRQGHVVRPGLHRAGRGDLRPVDSARRGRRGPAVRLHLRAAVDPVHRSTCRSARTSCSWCPTSPRSSRWRAWSARSARRPPTVSPM